MVGSGTGDLRFSPVEAKLRRPVHRDGLVAREQLVRRLAAAPERASLILLTAPAGYGKTTVLSQWAAADPRPFAWVTVDEADTDPVHLARHVALAMHRIQPVDPAVFGVLAVGDGPRHLDALPYLVASTRSWTRPGVLVLDEVQELRDVESINFIRALAAALPAGFHLAVGSRLVLGLGRFRSEERSAEFGPDDLAFSEEEVRAVLGRVGVTASAETVRALVLRTEAWPAGVHLAGRTISAAPDATGAAGGLSGDDPHVADYLRRELLAGESPETVRFLTRTAVLDQMGGALCDHVLGQNGSARRLADAARRNLFVVPLDRRGEWYRYHRLVGEMLRSELRRREPGEEFRLHRLAAGWYAEQGRPEEAIHHAIDGRDKLRAAHLIHQHAQEFVAVGRFRTVTGWLDALDDDGLAEFPPLAVTSAWMLALNGDPQGARRCLQAAERGTFDGPLPDGSSSLSSAVMVLRAAIGALGVQRMLVDAAAAIELESPGSPWFPAAMGTLGMAHALAGAPDAAAKELDLSVRLGREAGRFPAVVAALGQLALLAVEREDWTDAAERADEAVELMDSSGIDEHLLSILGLVAAARVAAHTGSEVTARQHLGRALRLYATPSPAAFPWLSAQVPIVLAETLLDLGDFAAARFRAEEARAHLAGLLTEGVLREQLRRLSARLAREGGHVRVPSPMALSKAEMRVLQLLPTHLSLGEIGDELHTSRSTVKTQVASVYRKLQCSTRTEAVRRARELGLLVT